MRCEQGILVRDLENDEVIDPGRVTAVMLAAFECGVRSLDKLLREGKVFANEQVIGMYLQHDDLLSRVVYDSVREKLQLFLEELYAEAFLFVQCSDDSVSRRHATGASTDTALAECLCHEDYLGFESAAAKSDESSFDLRI